MILITWHPYPRCRAVTRWSHTKPCTAGRSACGVAAAGAARGSTMSGAWAMA